MYLIFNIALFFLEIQDIISGAAILVLPGVSMIRQ